MPAASYYDDGVAWGWRYAWSVAWQLALTIVLASACASAIGFAWDAIERFMK